MPPYLVDTNVWLERLLNQAKAGEVGDFLDAVPVDQLAITDFSLHSIALAMARLSRFKGFLGFQEDLFSEPGVEVFRLTSVEGMKRIERAMERFSLDFDDAYQYVAARSHGTALVSFDSDFDRTDIVRKTPLQILKGLGGIEGESGGVREPGAVYRPGRRTRTSMKRRKR